MSRESFKQGAEQLITLSVTSSGSSSLTVPLAHLDPYFRDYLWVLAAHWARPHPSLLEDLSLPVGQTRGRHHITESPDAECSGWREVQRRTLGPVAPAAPASPARPCNKTSLCDVIYIYTCTQHILKNMQYVISSLI